MSDQIRAKCQVDDGILTPCNGLRKSSHPGRGRGVRIQTMVDMKSGKITRSFAVLRSGDFTKNGIVLNVCPFCGEHISGHVSPKTKEES